MRRHPAFVLFLILFVSLALRLFRIDFADGKPVFDEGGGYVPAARAYLEGRDDPNPYHPPLGKELIALGIATLGDNPYGWRIPSLVFSLLGIVLTFLLARELFGGAFIPLTSAFLVSVDSLYFVYSRLAVLDMFLTVFVLATLLFLWRVYQKGDVSSLLLLSASYGLVGATKWWNALFLAPVILLFLFLRFKLSSRLIGAGATIVAVSGAIYAGAYAPYLSRHSFQEFFGFQQHLPFIWRVYQGGEFAEWKERKHPGQYAALRLAFDHALRWALNPMLVYVAEPAAGGKLRAVVVHFNPVLYWGSLVFLVRILRSGGVLRDRRILFLFLPIMLHFAPWLVIHLSQFPYHFLPVLPLFAIISAYALHQLRETHRDRVILFLLVSAAAMVYDLPFLTGIAMDSRFINPLVPVVP